MRPAKVIACPRCSRSFTSPSPDVLETLFVRHSCKGSLPIDLTIRVISKEITERKAWALYGRQAS